MIGTINICKRCEYEWPSRIEGRPRQCPGCKSPRWDTEARKPGGEGSKAPAEDLIKEALAKPKRGRPRGPATRAAPAVTEADRTKYEPIE